MYLRVCHILGYTLKDSHCRHVCNCCLANDVKHTACRYVYDIRYLHQISLLSFLIHHSQTKC